MDGGLDGCVRFQPSRGDEMGESERETRESGAEGWVKRSEWDDKITLHGARAQQQPPDDCGALVSMETVSGR